MGATLATAGSDPRSQMWQRMVSLLEAERDALVANDAERIAALAAQKVELAQALAGAPPGTTEMALARLARDLNQVNSALLQQRLAQTQQALALLRPGTGGTAVGVYGRDGRAGTPAVSPRGLSVA